MLATEVTQDRATLGELDVAIDQIRQLTKQKQKTQLLSILHFARSYVGKVKAEGKLVCKPGIRLGVLLVLEVGLDVLEQQANGLAEAPQVPVAQRELLLLLSHSFAR